MVRANDTYGSWVPWRKQQACSYPQTALKSATWRTCAEDKVLEWAGSVIGRKAARQTGHTSWPPCCQDFYDIMSTGTEFLFQQLIDCHRHTHSPHVMSRWRFE